MSAYVCPNCHAESPQPGECAACGIPTIDRASVAPWGIQMRALASEGIARPGYSRGFLGCIAAELALPGLGLVAFGLATGAPWAVAVGAAVAASPWVAAWIGHQSRRRAASKRVAKVLGIDMNKAFAEQPVVPLASAGEGRVRVGGRLRTRGFALAPNGTPCAAAEVHSFGGDAANVASIGGLLELSDESGASALVRAEWVRVVDAPRHGNLLVVPPDADVEIVGDAHWVNDDDESAATNLRTQARRLVISGTRDAPVMIRVVHAKPREPTEVRVEPGPSHAATRAAVGGEVEDADAAAAADSPLRRANKG